MTMTDARTRSRRSGRLSEVRFIVLLLLPGTALLLGVVMFPLLRSLASAFFAESLLFPGTTWVGLDNIVAVLHDGFDQLLWQTLIFTVGATIVPFVIGLALALALNERFRGQRILRGAFLIPWLVPGVVVSFLWMWIFNANYGVLNGLLLQAGPDRLARRVAVPDRHRPRPPSSSPRPGTGSLGSW